MDTAPSMWEARSARAIAPCDDEGDGRNRDGARGAPEGVAAQQPPSAALELRRARARASRGRAPARSASAAHPDRGRAAAARPGSPSGPPPRPWTAFPTAPGGWSSPRCQTSGSSAPRSPRRSGVRPLPGMTELQAAGAYLASRKALIVLDNCEHLAQACAEAAEALLSAAPEVVVLATSRAPLGATGETEWRVPSLSLPATGDGEQRRPVPGRPRLRRLRRRGAVRRARRRRPP